MGNIILKHWRVEKCPGRQRGAMWFIPSSQTNIYTHLHRHLAQTPCREHTLYTCCVRTSRYTQHSRATVQLSLHGGPHTASRKELILDFLEQSEGSCEAAPRAARHRPPCLPRCRTPWRAGAGRPRRAAGCSAAPGSPTCSSAWTRTQL